MDAYGDAESFLATAEEYAALDHAGTIKAREFFLQHPRGQYEAVGFDEIGLGNRRDLFGHWVYFIRVSRYPLQSIPSLPPRVTDQKFGRSSKFLVRSGGIQQA